MDCLEDDEKGVAITDTLGGLETAMVETMPLYC